jgi:hypothetical protein
MTFGDLAARRDSDLTGRQPHVTGQTLRLNCGDDDDVRLPARPALNVISPLAQAVGRSMGMLVKGFEVC